MYSSIFEDAFVDISPKFNINGILKIPLDGTDAIGTLVQVCVMKIVL
jgi:hypothetical protein